MRFFACLCVVVVCLAPASYAATFTVSSSDDAGPGTLRQAILDANANPGADQIVFTVGTVITTFSLPVITSPVSIDGSFGSSRVTINGPLFDCSRAFDFSTGSSGSTLTRVVVNGFCESVAIGLDVSNVTVTASRLGAVRISGSNNRLGGTTEGSGNVTGITIITGDGNQLFRNSAPVVHLLFAADTRVGSTGNGNTLGSLLLQSSGGTIVEGNTIGFIDISNALPPAAGATITGNTINNGGIRIHSNGVDSFVGATILGNSIAGPGIPIDLGVDGPTPNDPAPDADLGPNNLQNFPVLTSAVLTPGQLTVSGTLASVPLTTYTVELFGNPAADPDMTVPLGTVDVTTDATGNASFTRTVTSPLPAADEVITATATNRTTGDTSEGSAPIAIVTPGQLGFAQPSYTVNEPDGSVTITVQRTGGSEGTVTVNYTTVNGSAVAPGDYTTQSGTLTFGPGVTTQTIVVPIVSDAIPEPSEAFNVQLSVPTGGATLGTAVTTVTINGTAAPAAIPTLSEWSLLALALGLAMAVLLRTR